MDSIDCSLDGKLFNALLNGLCKRLFYGETSITDEYLFEQLYSELDIDNLEAISQIEAFEQILKKAADNNWDAITLEEKLRNVMNSDKLKQLTMFWANESSKVHQELINSSRWNTSLDTISWRVDIKAGSKKSSDLNEPIAYISLKPKDKSAKADFEMNRTQVREFLDTLNTIQKSINEYS